MRNQDPKYLLEGQEVKVGIVGRCAATRACRDARTSARRGALQREPQRAAGSCPARQRTRVRAAERA